MSQEDEKTLIEAIKDNALELAKEYGKSFQMVLNVNPTLESVTAKITLDF